MQSELALAESFCIFLSIPLKKDWFLSKPLFTTSVMAQSSGAPNYFKKHSEEALAEMLAIEATMQAYTNFIFLFSSERIN